MVETVTQLGVDHTYEVFISWLHCWACKYHNWISVILLASTKENNSEADADKA